MSIGLRNLGKYKLQERLEKVGRVETWKAVDPSLRCYVTIKVILDDQEQGKDPGFIARLEREAKIIRTLHHPNIVQITDVYIARPSESENTAGYLVMDYIEGPTLADYIHNITRTKIFPPPADIVHFFKVMGDAIDYAHHKGIIHGNIKPTNILLQKHSLSSMGKPMLTDFGTAKLQGTSTSILSLWGLVMPLYLSPEQCRGEAANAHSDIYALGVILYEMCTGTLPFQGESPSAIMIQHLDAAPKPPILINPKMPPALSAIILHSLEKNPKMRFRNAAAMATALAEVFEPGTKNIFTTDTNRRRPVSIPQTPVIDHNNLTGPPTNSNPAKTELSPGAIAFTAPTPSTHSKFVAQPPTRPPAPSRNGPELPTQPTLRTSPNDWQPRGASKVTSTPRFAASGQPLKTFTPPPQPALPPAPLPRPATKSSWKRSSNNSGLLTKKLPITIILTLIFLLSGLSTCFVLAHQRKNAGPVPVVGHVYFISSWQANTNNDQGVNDELLVKLQNVPAPRAGKSYYAWLLGDANQPEMPWVPLGKVSERHGEISFLYPGDELHSNLLADCSRFLITEEDAHQTQNNPFLDPTSWRYYAAIPQTPSSTDMNHFSMLDHLRHLLVQAPELDALGLPGGMGTWLHRNTEEVLRWAVEAKDRFMEINVVRSLLANILYYIDGECTSSDLQGVPPDMPVTPSDATTAHIAHFALLNPCEREQLEQANDLKHVFHHTPHDYLDHILFHLAGVIRSPGATAATRMLAAQINTAINNVQGWLSQARRDALLLAHMTDVQLVQLPSLAILDDMTLQASFAYAGRIDLATGNMQEGVTWIYDALQRLATLDVTPY